MTLEHLREVHDRAPTRKAAVAARGRARDLAKTLGVAVPDWAAARSPGRTRTPAPPPRSDEPTVPIEVAPALSAWRAGGPGRVVNVRRDGSVRLVVLGLGGARQEAAFTDARMAERALLLGVTWRPVAQKAG